MKSGHPAPPRRRSRSIANDWSGQAFLLVLTSSLGCTTPSNPPTHAGPIASSAVQQAAPPVPIAAFPTRSRELYESSGDEYMIVTQGEASTRAAKRMFEQGGNVFDAAAAASFALAVERPQSTGVAGGGFIVAHVATTHEVLAVDFREVAPEKAGRDMFLDKNANVAADRSTDGGLASGVPGMVAGVLVVHKKYGKLDRAAVLAPAIELATTGFDVYPHMAGAIKQRSSVLKKSPEALSIFFKDGKADQPLGVGDRIRQPGLAKVLAEIAKSGPDGFYRGWVAKALVAEQERQHGLISLKDLASYQPKFRSAVRGEFGPYSIVSMPPPSSGGVHVVEILNILEGYQGHVTDPYGVENVHRTASAMEMAYFDRAHYLGDPDFVRVPIAGLTSQPYADAWHSRIDPSKATHLTPEKQLDPVKYESHETTHFTIADKAGNIVTSTQTINGWLGSGVVVQGAGFVMNNEMDDFSAKPGSPNKFGVIGGEENGIAPAKRPLSSMSPTIVLKDNSPVLALGSPAGSQIINCVALTILNYTAYRMPLWDAVTAVRYHHQWTPDKIVVEEPGLSDPTQQALRAMGYTLEVGDIGCKVEAIAYENGHLHGVSDPRGEGLAAGEKPIPRPAPLPVAPETKIKQD